MAEPDNPADRNAVRVCAAGGKTVGYFSRDYAIEYGDVFKFLADHGFVGACRAKLIGGIGRKKSYGVLLDVRDAESLLEEITRSLAPGSPLPESAQPF